MLYLFCSYKRERLKNPKNFESQDRLTCQFSLLNTVNQL